MPSKHKQNQNLNQNNTQNQNNDLYQNIVSTVNPSLNNNNNNHNNQHPNLNLNSSSNLNLNHLIIPNLTSNHNLNHNQNTNPNLNSISLASESTKDEEISFQVLKTHYEKLIKNYKKVHKKLKPYFDGGLKEDGSNCNTSDVVLCNILSEFNSIKCGISSFLEKYGCFVKKRKNSFGRFCAELYNQILGSKMNNKIHIENESNINSNLKASETSNNVKSGNNSKGGGRFNKKGNDENRENMKSTSKKSSDENENFGKNNSGNKRSRENTNYGAKGKESIIFIDDNPPNSNSNNILNSNNNLNSNLSLNSNLNYQMQLNKENSYPGNNASRNSIFDMQEQAGIYNRSSQNTPFCQNTNEELNFAYNSKIDPRSETLSNIKNSQNLYPSIPTNNMNSKNSPNGNRNKREQNIQDGRMRNGEEYIDNRDGKMNKGGVEFNNPSNINNNLYNHQPGFDNRNNRLIDPKMNQPNSMYMCGRQLNNEENIPGFYNPDMNSNIRRPRLDNIQMNKDNSVFRNGLYEPSYYNNNQPSNVFHEQTINPNVFFNEPNQSQNYNVNNQPQNNNFNNNQRNRIQSQHVGIEKRKEAERRFSAVEIPQENADLFVNQHSAFNRNFMVQKNINENLSLNFNENRNTNENLNITGPSEFDENQNINKMKVIDKKRIEECLGQVQLSEEGKAYLLDMCDMFIESVCYTSVCISKSRNSRYLDIEDVKMAVKTDGGFDIVDDSNAVKNVSIDSDHEKKVTMVAKENSKRNKM